MTKPRPVSLALAVCLLGGCQQTLASPGTPAHFALGLAARPDSAALVAGGKSTANPANSTSVAAPGAVGELRIDVAKALPLASRALLSTLADVDHIDVTLTGPGGVTTTQTIAKAAFQSGQTVVNFLNLVVGSWTYEVIAYQSWGSQRSGAMGYATGQTIITANQVTNLAVPLQLSPTYVAAPPGAGGGSGTTPADVGGLSATVTLADGLVFTDLPFKMNGVMSNYRFYVTPPAGTSGILSDEINGSGILRTSVTNQVLDSWPSTAGKAISGALDASGALWATVKTSTTSNVFQPMRFAAGSKVGTVFTQAILPPGLVPTPDGLAWGYSATGGLVKLAADGTTAATANIPANSSPLGAGNEQPLHCDAAGNIYAITSLGGGHTGMTKVSPTGSVLVNYTAPEVRDPICLALDGAGNVWCVNHLRDPDGRYHLVKLSATGTLLGTFPTDSLPNPNAPASAGDPLDFCPTLLAFDPSGNAWVAYETNACVITKFSSTGTHLGLYTGPFNAYNILFDSAGNFWVT